jgi:choline transport protein
LHLQRTTQSEHCFERPITDITTFLSGGQYHWVSEFAPKKHQKFLSYIAGWLSVLGWQTALVGSAYSVGLAVQGMIALNNPGYTVPSWHGVVLTIGAVLLTIIFNTIGLRKLPSLEGAMLVVHIFAFIAIFTVLWVMGDRAPAHEVFTTWSDPQGWGSVRLPHSPYYVCSLTWALTVWRGNARRIVVGHLIPSW